MAPVQPVIATAAKAAQPVVTALQPVVATATEVAQPVVTALQPVIASAVSATQSVVAPVQPVIATAAKAAQPVVTALQPVVASATEVAQPVVTALQPVIASAVGATQPVVAAVQPVIATATKAAQSVVTALQPVVAAATEVAQPVITSVSTITQPVISITENLAATLLPPVSGIVSSSSQGTTSSNLTTAISPSDTKPSGGDSTVPRGRWFCPDRSRSADRQCRCRLINLAVGTHTDRRRYRARRANLSTPRSGGLPGPARVRRRGRLPARSPLNPRSRSTEPRPTSVAPGFGPRIV